MKLQQNIPGENLISDISSVLSLVKTVVFNVFESTIMKLPARIKRNLNAKIVSKILREWNGKLQMENIILMSSIILFKILYFVLAFPVQDISWKFQGCRIKLAWIPGRYAKILKKKHGFPGSLCKKSEKSRAQLRKISFKFRYC